MGRLGGGAGSRAVGEQHEQQPRSSGEQCAQQPQDTAMCFQKSEGGPCA